MSVIDEALHAAAALRADGQLERAAATLDAVAWRDRERVLPPLKELLDALAFVEHGLTFRYVPAGTFLRGSEDGDADERPVRELSLPGFWLSEAPLSWAELARALGWPTPPELPSREQLAALDEVLGGAATGALRPSETEGLCLRLRFQYCEDFTLRAEDWHAHTPGSRWGHVERSSEGPYRYEGKPAVAVPWELASLAASRLSSGASRVRLPTEAEWERSARGCFRGARFPWGDAPPDATRADFGAFERFALRPTRDVAPNDYGLYAMAGGVWEWCEDHYDARFYERCPSESPRCHLPALGADARRVLRGGSWADCADALRASFRSTTEEDWSANVGFRVLREAR